MKQSKYETPIIKLQSCDRHGIYAGLNCRTCIKEENQRLKEYAMAKSAGFGGRK